MEFGSTFEADLNDFIRPDAGDEKLFVVFYMGIVRNEAETIEKGRPIYTDTEFVRIFTPGDKTNVIDQPATARDKQRFAKQYAAFKQGIKEEDQVEGTRLTDWPMIGRAQAEELRHLGFRTVEQIAEARDDVMARVPFLSHLKNGAKAWLGKTKASSEAAKQAKEMDDLRAQNASLQEAVRDLMSRYETLQAKLSQAA